MTGQPRVGLAASRTRWKLLTPDPRGSFPPHRVGHRVHESASTRMSGRGEMNLIETERCSAPRRCLRLAFSDSCARPARRGGAARTCSAKRMRGRSSTRQLPRRRSDSPFPYPSAVSKKLRPVSRARSMRLNDVLARMRRSVSPEPGIAPAPRPDPQCRNEESGGS